MLSKIKDACSAAAAPIAQIHSDIRLSKNIFVRLAYHCLQICLLVVIFLLLGRLLAQARNPFLIASTQELAVKYNSFSFFSLAKRIVKKYCLYIALGLAISLIMLYSTCQLINHRKKQIRHGEEKQSKKGKIFFILFFLLVFYLVTICLLANARDSYNQFLQEFEKGSLEEQELTTSTKQHLFPGFKKYHYLSHYQETKNILAHFALTSNHDHKETLFKEVRALLKEQGRALSTLRTFFKNIKLAHTLTHIFYYSGMAVFIGFTVCFLLCFTTCFRHQFSCSSRNYSILDQYQEGENNNQPQSQEGEQRQYSKCFIACYLIIFLIFAGVCFGCFLLAEATMEFRSGKRYDSNKEQTQLCSFHQRSGGLGINIDYQTQLDISSKVTALDLNLKHYSRQEEELVNDLENRLDLYTNFCEILNPYFKKSKELQANIPALVYSHFLAFLFLLWQVTTIPNCCQT